MARRGATHTITGPTHTIRTSIPGVPFPTNRGTVVAPPAKVRIRNSVLITPGALVAMRITATDQAVTVYYNWQGEVGEKWYALPANSSVDVMASNIYVISQTARSTKVNYQTLAMFT